MVVYCTYCNTIDFDFEILRRVIHSFLSDPGDSDDSRFGFLVDKETDAIEPEITCDRGSLHNHHDNKCVVIIVIVIVVAIAIAIAIAIAFVVVIVIIVISVGFLEKCFRFPAVFAQQFWPLNVAFHIFDFFFRIVVVRFLLFQSNHFRRPFEPIASYTHY
jgi:hypothetical protein